MKKRVLLVPALLFAVILAACGQSAVPSVPEASSGTAAPPVSSETGPDGSAKTEDIYAITQIPFTNDGSYQIKAEKYQTSLRETRYYPLISDGKILVTGYGGANTNIVRTLLYDIKTGEETELDISAGFYQMSGGYIYYVYRDADGSLNMKTGEERQIIKCNIETGEEDVIYEIQGDGKSISSSMAISGDFLAWYEFVLDGAAELRWDMTGIPAETVVFDLRTEEVAYRAENTVAFRPGSAPDLCGDGKVILTVESGDGYNLKVADFLNGDTIYEKNVEKIPRDVEYDNQRFAYITESAELDVFDTLTGEKTHSQNANLTTGGSVLEIQILDGRFLIYGNSSGIFVTDLNTGEMVYSSHDDNERYYNSEYLGSEQLYRYMYGGLYVNRESKQVVSDCTDRTMEYTSGGVFVLNFAEDGAAQ